MLLTLESLVFYKNVYICNLTTLFKNGLVLDIDTWEHRDSLESQHLIQLDHGSLDLKFERDNFEKFKILTFFIK